MARHHINSQNTIIFFDLCPKIYLILYPPLGNSTTRITHSEGQVVGGYYADPAAECQVFHVCATDSAEAGPNSKWSFLCPNGTIFNQNYFICDWWFNFDCAEAEGLYGLNDQLGATGDDQAQYGADDQSQYNEAASNTQETYESPAAYGKPKKLS